jgi:rhodanese-related sulfurtransferase
MASYNEISTATLARLIGTPDCPVLLDVRIDEDFGDDPHLIPGAYRHSFLRVGDLAESLKRQHVVVYCQKGLKIDLCP